MQDRAARSKEGINEKQDWVGIKPWWDLKSPLTKKFLFLSFRISGSRDVKLKRASELLEGSFTHIFMASTQDILIQLVWGMT